MKYTIYLFVALLFNFAEGYRILALFPVNAPSHFGMYKRLLIGLAEKGHDVDVLSHYPLKKPIPRYNDLSVQGSLMDYTNNLLVSYFEDMDLFDTIVDIVVPGGVEICDTILNTTVAKNLKVVKTKYDLVITEIFGTDCMLGFAHLFQVPSIGIISSVNLPWASDRIGNPDYPSYIPNYFLLYSSKMSLTERVVNTIVLLFSKSVYYFYSERDTDRLVKNFFGNQLPDLQELVYNTSLIFVNSHFSINQARPMVPNFIEVGGLHIGDVQPLPKNIKDIINSSNGIIYFSMGSMVVSESFSEDKLQNLFDAFAELPFTVLWKADTEKFPKSLVFPKNIHFLSWMPQLDILCNSKVKLFVTHGGLMGIQEAIHCGVPHLGIPLFADQELNIQQSQLMGVALKVSYKDISKTSILKAAKALLEDSNFQVNAKRMSQLFKDRPVTPLETAVYWVEYVIRHNGGKHLRTVGADLPWYQYFLVDVIIIIATIFVIISLITFWILRNLLRLVCKLGQTRNKIKTN